MMSEYMVEKWKRKRESERLVWCGEMQNSRSEGWEGQTDVGIMLVTLEQDDIQPGLLPRTMCEPLVLLQPGSVLVSMIHIVTKGHRDARGLELC